ncbi:MAG: competence/damage-inducible protein A [Candidatus Cloacimonadaceae bacterium]|jgi:nicotinamide-nucleotide amidase|nr:competence/damage-inducible protein A [Candidatus Cloacimonadota bacterium]MCB5258686.1 competence/damage-inducible protein A [Candidatus Cloacimonadota bacterium]MDD5624407.1 competence/damage-inducible protein A [Candidatus Cloacimonadota bacterium]MDY0112029.1 competence/damage-inducible protein A [Candidatus Syntrophosphaera sp.]
MKKSAVITIGNEILLGKTLNSNLAFLAQELANLGLPVDYAVTVKDEAAAIHQALKHCWNKYDVVITTGGLGPTTDDITKQEIASFFGKKLTFNAEVWEQVQQIFATRNMPTPEINRSQAMVPEDFIALKNERGTAPGLFYEEGEKSFFAFAGVPMEMKHIFLTQAKPILEKKYGTQDKVIQKTIHTFGISESALAELLTDFQPPEKVSFAWLPQTGRVDLRFYGTDSQAIEQAFNECYPQIKQYVWGFDEDTPVSVLHHILREKKLYLSVAESCTGGLIQKMVTDLAGSSDVFLGGVVSYANELKIKVLKVKPETLKNFGAVSEECAGEMVQGVKELTGSDLAISTTGIAGPEGGTSEKPVGMVCFGFSVLNDIWSKTHIFNGDRELIRLQAAEFALLNLIRYLQGHKF